MPELVDGICIWYMPMRNEQRGKWCHRFVAAVICILAFGVSAAAAAAGAMWKCLGAERKEGCGGVCVLYALYPRKRVEAILFAFAIAI